MAKVREMVKFRLIETPCCHTLLCYINPRYPNYCSECGERIFLKVHRGECNIATDENAWLEHERF